MLKPSKMRFNTFKKPSGDISLYTQLDNVCVRVLNGCGDINVECLASQVTLVIEAHLRKKLFFKLRVKDMPAAAFITCSIQLRFIFHLIVSVQRPPKNTLSFVLPICRVA